MFKKQTFLAAILFMCASLLQAQTTTRNSYEAAIGIQSYYLPSQHFKFQNAQPVFTFGANHAINTRQTIELGVRLGYNRHKYQGDALYIQALFRYAPVIAKHIQPMIGTGIGYQLSFYPSSALKLDGNNWVNATRPKGVIQVPLQLGIGYRGFENKKAIITPYFAYQVNALFRYSPDLTPLPSSQLLLGLRYSPKKF
jgi:hypothetical protein